MTHQDDIKEILTKELLQDNIVMLMVKNNVARAIQCIDIALDSTQETELCKLYTICRYTIYLISTFCQDAITTDEIKDKLAISNYISLSTKNKIFQGLQMSYQNKIIKEYLKCSNTILYLADTVQLGGALDKNLYEACKTKLIDTQSKIYEGILNDTNELLDKKLWVDTVGKIDTQLKQEIEYLDKNTPMPSLRMKANMGISKSEYRGIQALLDYNKTYKIEELV